jgi:hypothetical protein
MQGAQRASSGWSVRLTAFAAAFALVALVGVGNPLPAAASSMKVVVVVGQGHDPSHGDLVVEADERFDFSTLPEAEKWDVRSYAPAFVGIWEKQPSITSS